MKMAGPTTLAMMTAATMSMGGCCCPSEADLEASRKRTEERKERAKKKAAEREKKILKEENLSEFLTSMTIEIEVDGRKGNGKRWDRAKGKPDPIVKVWNKRTGRVLVSKVHKDRLSARVFFDNFAVSGGDRINFRVEDKDVAVNDEIGDFDLRFRPSLADSGNLENGYIKVHFEDETSNQ